MEKAKEAIKVVKGARLIDGNGGPVLRKAVVVIEGGRIKAIGVEGKIRVPKEAEVIDMKACTLMPGLMDIHLHCSAHNPITYKNYRVAQLEATPPLQMLTTLLHQQIML